MLLLAAGAYLAPSVHALRAAGFRVVSVDRNPQAPGHAAADARVVASITDVDAIAAAARTHDVGVILPGIEASVVAAAEASERLGLPQIGVDVAVRCTDKVGLREAWRRAGLLQPEFREVPSAGLRAAIEEFGFPCVVKPARNGGSVGVSVLDRASQLDGAIADATRNAPDGRCIVERFVEGPLLTADGFVRDEEVVVAMIGDVVTQEETRHRVNMALNYPARYDAAVVAEARALIVDAVRAVGLRRGAFHIECIVGPEGVMLVELAARGGGSYLSSTVVGEVSGLDGPVTFARLLLGDTVDLRPTRARGASLRFLRAPEGIVDAVAGVAAARRLPGVVSLDVAIGSGAAGGIVVHDNARHGHVVAVGSDRDEAVARAEAAAAAVRFVMRAQVPTKAS
ncbi:MAG TPA: ATP-grasp domain-containing protein [Candidatus Elarobacter sp.]